MPSRFSGREVARISEHNPGLDGIPAVLMSTVPPEKEREKDHHRAFVGVVCSLAPLLEAIEGLIGRPDTNLAGNQVDGTLLASLCLTQ
jgi:hypothetical protein